MKLSDPYNVSTFASRATGVTIGFCFLIFVLAVRLWYLQIWRGEELRAFSDRNRFKIEKLAAPRGPIFDREGVLIADSRPRFDLTITRGYSPDLEREMLLVKDILKWDSAKLDQVMVRISKAGRYQEVVIATDLTFDELTLIESHSLDLEGLEIKAQSVRDYLYGQSFFHVLGYTREVGDSDLKTIQSRYPAHVYSRGDQIGVKGIEALYESFLKGKEGNDFVVVDVKGRRVARSEWRLLPQIPREEPRSGTGLRLTIDASLQLVAQKALMESGHAGAVVALDPRNGEVLALVSVPALEPNAFTGVLTGKTLKGWIDRDDKPFLDRTMGEHYVPGSIFKLVVAAAALEQGIIDERTSYFCPGYYRFGNRAWKCHAKDGHGRVTIVQALERSCDVFFYNIGLKMGLDSIYHWAARYGFGRRTALGHEAFKGKLDSLFRFNSEQTGFIPSLEWVQSKRRTTVDAEVLNASIGQGAVTVTMIQLARMVAALTNGGKVHQPQLVLSTLDAKKQAVESFQGRLETTIQLEPRTEELILRGMEEVVQGKEGTARASRIANLMYGGKTGTAQVAALAATKNSTLRRLQDHALFVAVAPSRNPHIAIAVIVENGGQGSRAAAPIARQMLEVYFSKAKMAKKESENHER